MFHIERLKELGLQKSLILADRGYPSFGFLARLIDNDFNFLIRVPKTWKTLVGKLEQNPNANNFNFYENGEKYTYRAYRVILDNGEPEWLVTSLDEEALSEDEAKELYTKRWGIETKYGFIKNKLQLENFSGKTVVAIKQEFYAAVYLSNLCSAVAKAADVEIENEDLKKLSNIREKQTETASLTELWSLLLPLCSNITSENNAKC
jgi:hypothetical protein